MAPPATSPLHELAGLYGIETSYYDAAGKLRQASDDALLAVLQTAGAPLDSVGGAPDAVRERRVALWQKSLEPVFTCWEGNPPSVQVRLPSSATATPLHFRMVLENGDQREYRWLPSDLPVVATQDIEGVRFEARRVPLPGPLPFGYHKLFLEGPGEPVESLIISAPRTGYTQFEGPEARIWGTFLPLYSLFSERSWGIGDLTDLQSVLEWTAGLGGTAVATLPLLAAFLDEPFEPSPYAPASRLFWNELYVDPARTPEFQKCPRAQQIVASQAFQSELAALKTSPLLDYRRLMALKRPVLEEMARCCYSNASGRLDAFQRFMQADPVLEDYAKFRAVCQKQHAAWPAWPAPLREGIIGDQDYDQETKRYHLYVQWLAREQVQAVSENARRKGVKLYFDLPLGAHPDSYDVWRERSSFALGISAGAPLDPFFSEGQDWGFPPLHPERLREQGHRYFIACVRHQMKHAGILRVDHIMGFHRLFWIPRGMKATDGVYVRYHPEEFYAILTLESSRNKCIVIGEDLGTVPAEVRPAMAAHALHRTYVLQFSLNADLRSPIGPISEDMAATVDTHDLPTFAAWWQCLDLQERVDMGLLQQDAAANEKEYREAIKKAVVECLRRRGPALGPTSDMQGVLASLLSHLGGSPAHIVLVNLEDLWLETRRQNMPGTWGAGHPNWRRKAQHSFETFSRLPQVMDTLRRVDYQRRKDFA